MIKLVEGLRRLPSLTREEFQQHWLEHHASLLLNIPTLRSYVQYHTIGNNPMARKTVATDPPFDGHACYWWDSLDAFRSVRNSTEYQRVLDDLKDFIGPNGSFLCYVEERMIAGIDAGADLVLIECHSHRPGQTRANFQKGWYENTGGFGREIYKTGLMSGFLQNNIYDSSPETEGLGLDQARFDGVGFAYYHSLAQLTACVSLPIVTERAFKAEDGFTDQKKMGSVWARRIMLRPPLR